MPAGDFGTTAGDFGTAPGDFGTAPGELGTTAGEFRRRGMSPHCISGLIESALENRKELTSVDWRRALFYRDRVVDEPRGPQVARRRTKLARHGT